MFSNACIPLICRPTRITPTTATLIDNIYSNDLTGNENQINGISYADISDHLPIFVLTKRIRDDTQTESPMIHIICYAWSS